MAVGDTARLLASLELQDKFSGPAANAERSLDRLEGKVGTLGRVQGEVGRGLGNLARNVATIGVFAGGAAVALIGKSVADASQLEQAAGAVETVFGRVQGKLNEFARTGADTVGLSQRQIKEMGAVLGAQLQGMGVGLQESVDLTIDLEKRGADLAATFGGTTAEAVQAISSLLRGERDPIERYGVSLKQVDINARVAALGLDTSTAATKKTSEATAALDLLLESTAKTEGQFARESDTLAGAQSRLTAKLENTRAILGTALLPVIAKVADRLNTALTDHMPDIERFAATLPGIFDQLLSVVERLPWQSIGDAFSLMGQGAKAALDIFTSMPDWVQTAVLTGWGLNHLTGGALGNIVGALGSGLIKGVLGMNAGVVNINAAVVNGGGGGVPGAPGGKGKLPFIGAGAGVLGALAVPLILSGSDDTNAEMENKRIQLTKQLDEGIINAAEAGRLWAEAYGKTVANPFLDPVLGPPIPKTLSATTLAKALGITLPDTSISKPGAGTLLPDTAMQPVTAGLGDVESAVDRLPPILQGVRSKADQQLSRQYEALQAARGGNILLGQVRTKADQQLSQLHATLQAARGQTGLLSQIRDKPATVNVNVPVYVTVGVSEIQYRLHSLRETIGGGGYI